MKHYVLDTMSRNPVLAGADRDAHAIAADARSRGVHQVVVTDGVDAVGVVTTASLERADAGESVRSCMTDLHFETVAQSDTLEAAEAIMDESGKSCLPVTDWSGHLVGVITRGDLRRRREHLTNGAAPLSEVPCETLGAVANVRSSSEEFVPSAHCAGRSGDVPDLSLDRLMNILETRRVGIPEPIALYVALEILGAIGAMHLRTGATDQASVHRDVSPENWFIDLRGAVKLADPELVKDLTASPRAPERACASWRYLSPEQARGAPADHRSDLFSFAIILAELLLQRRLFSGKTPVALLEQALRADVSTLWSAGSRVSSELEFILSVALEADPEARFQTARELGDALLDFSAHQDWSLPTPGSVASWLTVNRLIRPDGRVLAA